MATELWKLSATELARRIARGECTSVDAVEAHIARIGDVDRSLNALVVKRFDAALAEARDADRARDEGRSLGRLHGVPITVKESLDVVGLPKTWGLRSRSKSSSAVQDDPYVARLRAAGAIVLGKTNVSQLLIFYEADNPVYGRTNNPWSVKRTPGGSSGGEAALIAAGGSPLGIGTDIGGSLRVPATFCGLSAMKPTQGRLPDTGGPPIFAGQTAIESATGAIAREVADVVLAIECMNGGRNPAAEPPRPLGDPHALDVSTLRIGYYSRAGSFAAAPGVARAVEEAAGALHQLGARVVPFDPPYPDHAEELFYGILSADGVAGARAVLGRTRRDRRVADLMKYASKDRAGIARTIGFLKLLGQHRLARVANTYGFQDTSHYWQLVAEQAEYRRRFAEALDRAASGPIDVLLGPACALPAFAHGESRTLGTIGAYATMYNVLGYPAGVVPITRIGRDEEVGRVRSRDWVEKAALKAETGSFGLPVGVQVIARPWREHVAFAVMLALEAALRKRPDYPRTPIDIA
ncbi:MAG: amidase [Candidatus Eremiobacteraeota bacterium]|nr:amidase [Candidatus Eremiobacteraeota bacterium]